MIAILDYDAGNIKSVEKAVQYLGYDAVNTRDRDTILAASHVILPGVGNFGDAMEKLRMYQLDSVIEEVIAKKIPFMGICLGLQLLFESSEESPGVSGLGILEGTVKRFPEQKDMKIPQIGWNSLTLRKGSKLFRDIAPDSYVYFVHSYYLDATHPEEVCARADYITAFDAAIEKDQIFACQFHPEKSGRVGLKILRNFLTSGEEE